MGTGYAAAWAGVCAIAGVHTLACRVCPGVARAWAAGWWIRRTIRCAGRWRGFSGLACCWPCWAWRWMSWERQTPVWHSPTLAAGLLVLVLIGVTLMPASGFWLGLVAWRLWVLSGLHSFGERRYGALLWH